MSDSNANVTDELSILNGFNKYFEMVPALDDELRNEVYKLRFQVYCIETGFENAGEFENHMEKDDKDYRSVHYLIKHKKSDAFVATTRLILPDPDDSEILFPVEENCQIDDLGVLTGIPRTRIAEASRFCVSKQFKRRKSDVNTVAGIGDGTYEASFSEDERGTFPHISLALFASLLDMSKKHNIDHWYVAMEPALYRFFDRLGVKVQTIGPLIDYHGKRKPGAAAVETMIQGAKEKNIKVWHMFTNSGHYW